MLCPRCKSPDYYEGIIHVECGNPKCVLYPKSKRKTKTIDDMSLEELQKLVDDIFDDSEDPPDVID